MDAPLLDIIEAERWRRFNTAHLKAASGMQGAVAARKTKTSVLHEALESQLRGSPR